MLRSALVYRRVRYVVFMVLALVMVFGPAALAAAGVFMQTAKLTASDGAAEDFFGVSVAVDGDTVVIGARAKDGARGAAYVFERNGGAWAQTAKLAPAELEDGDIFALAVAISGDTIIVGARGDDDFANGGAVYVFEKIGGLWTQTAKLTTATSTWLGHSVAVDGETIVAGGVASQVGGNASQGDAYIFEKVGGLWTQTARIFASDGGPGDTFGQDVAVSGDRVVVGADWHDAAGVDAGGVWVYEKIGGIWIETAKLQSNDIAAGDSFGGFVDVEGDTIVASALQDDDNGENSGSAYIFAYNGGAWTQIAKLLPADGAANDRAAFVSLSGDRIVFGSLNHAELGEDAGAVWLFERIHGIWTETGKLLASDGAAHDLFGSTAISGNVIVAGARRDDDLGENSGSAYVFEAGAPRDKVTRFRGFVYEGPARDMSTPIAGVNLTLYGRDAGEPEPGSLQLARQSQPSGFFNFLVTEPYQKDYYTLMAETPAGMVPVGAWSETGTVANGYLVSQDGHEPRITWEMPAAEVHENEFYFEIPALPPAEPVTGTVDLPLETDTWVTWGNQTTNYDSYQSLIIRPSGLDNALLKFDRSALPQGATILGATLNVHMSAQTGAAGKHLAVLNAAVFTPRQATYAHAPTVYNPSAAVDVPVTPAVLSFDVASQVAAWDAPFTSYHWGYLALSASGSNGRIVLDSLEIPYGSPATLSVTYTTAD